MEYYKKLSFKVKEIREAVYYLIIIFVAIVNRIWKRNSRVAAELAIFVINLRNIEKALRFKLDFINKEFKKIIFLKFYNLLFV